MPLERAQWFTKQSAFDKDQLRAQQCSTYYSVVNVDKTNDPFRSSYEQQQTWTLARTMANNSKRYQTSIENIFLATPTLSLTTKSLDYEIIKAERDRPMSLLPLSVERISTAPRPVPYTSVKPLNQQEERPLPIRSILNKNSKLTNNVFLNEPYLTIRSMRVIHINGELVVRI